MTKYLGLLRLSESEATRMLRDGPDARRDFIELIVREGGGRKIRLDAASLARAGGHR